MRTHAEAGARAHTAGAVAALVVSLAAVVTFGSIVAGVGEWFGGRELSVVLPWALPALVVSAVAAVAAVSAVGRRRGAGVAIVGAAVVVVMLVALVLVNPGIAQPIA